MSAGPYDAAFSALGRLYGRDARAAITQLTLWGGFASTVCWPITAWLVESVDWRGTCPAYAGLHLAVTLPLSLFFMPRTPPAEETSHESIAGARGAPGLLDLRFLCIAGAGVALSMVATIWSIHLVTILTAGATLWPRRSPSGR